MEKSTPNIYEVSGYLKNKLLCHMYKIEGKQNVDLKTNGLQTNVKHCTIYKPFWSSTWQSCIVYSSLHSLPHIKWAFRFWGILVRTADFLFFLTAQFIMLYNIIDRRICGARLPLKGVYFIFCFPWLHAQFLKSLYNLWKSRVLRKISTTKNIPLKWGFWKNSNLNPEEGKPNLKAKKQTTYVGFFQKK